MLEKLKQRVQYYRTIFKHALASSQSQGLMHGPGEIDFHQVVEDAKRGAQINTGEVKK